MKLVTFEFKGKEDWGFVLTNPADGRQWVYCPALVDRELQRSATMTNGYSVSMPKFMKNSAWPDTLCGFLETEEEGMAVLRRLEGFLRRFLQQSDEGRMTFCGHPLDDVRLCAPVPMPRLMWGLVQNCPTFIRSNPARTGTNLFPQGHQRPMGSVVGHGEIFVHPAGAGPIAFNVELGVVIGKKGRYIPVNEAMKYVAGFTAVTDSSTRGYTEAMDLGTKDVYEASAASDWYVGATMSWGGKMTDAHCAMGPWIVTPDEIGNVYDLLVYTKMSGHLRDRAHTSALLLGVERVIQWYSSFATLYPGDVIHLGTMGTDGLQIPEEFAFSGPGCTIDSEIEDVGYLSTPVLDLGKGDWRSPDDESLTIHESPAVRKIIKSGKGVIDSPEEWGRDKARQFYTLFKNYYRVREDENIRVLKTPRFLCAPNSAIGNSGDEVELPPGCRDLEISVELAAVVKKVSKRVGKDEADAAVLGYIPMISLTDSSFDDIITEPTTLQERGMPLLYGRWADGFNVVNPVPVPMSEAAVRGRRMTLTVDGKTVTGNTDEYVCLPSGAFSFMSLYITLLPGDVVTFGHISERIRIPAGEITDGMRISGEIEGIGSVSFTLKHSASADNSGAVNVLKL